MLDEARMALVAEKLVAQVLGLAGRDRLYRPRLRGGVPTAGRGRI